MLAAIHMLENGFRLDVNGEEYGFFPFAEPEQMQCFYTKLENLANQEHAKIVYHRSDAAQDDGKVA